jgi:thioredoxin 1
MSSFASQCPLFGVCHRAFTSLTSAVRRSGEQGSAPQATIEATGAKGATAPVILTDSNFPQTVERSKGVALVDFWAPWCMPCRRVGPTIERLAGEYAGRATVGKLNVDQNMAVARRYGISGIPTVGVFRNGKLVNQLVGIQSEQTYRKAVESALAQVAATATTATTSAGAKTTKTAKTAKTAKASARP